MTPEQALLETQAPVEMITVVIDGFEVTVPKGTLVTVSYTHLTLPTN